MNPQTIVKAAAKRYEAFTRDYYRHGSDLKSFDYFEAQLSGMRVALLMAEEEGDDTLKARVEIADMITSAHSLTFMGAP